MTEDTKTAVVLFNLGGPDRSEAVQPFLRNLFSDKTILNLPQPLRWLCARVIAGRRAETARHFYARIGGKSPILENTRAQAEALQRALSRHGQYKTFVCMRYWRPMSDQVAAKVREYDPDRIILLPLYPHYSSTTTASSFSDWERAARRARLNRPTRRICCYPTEHGFIAAQVEQLMRAYWEASQEGTVRILFSAHGLPEKVIRKGDPYQWQIEQTVRGILHVLAMDDAQHAICYQSKVGPLKWIGPSTEEEIRRAGQDGVAIVLVPVSFVSEHVETLVELDIEYATLAQECGVRHYARVPALGINPHYIEGLASLCQSAQEPTDAPVRSHTGSRFCPVYLTQCPCRSEKAHVG